MTRATILIPTHDHWLTLPLAARSALQQSVEDIEVIIVGDGVTKEVRAAAEDLVRADSRIRFLDLPKGPNHGEIYRDRAIRESRSEAIFYLCDDDLLLDRHVENLLGLLEEADLVQSRNGYVDSDGSLRLFPADLSDPECIAWHLRVPRRNATSLTGTAHRVSTYRTLPEGWTTTPPNEWPDHFMWKKFFRREDFRGATHQEMTAVQLPTSSGREHVGQAERHEELVRWRDRLEAPGAHEWLQLQVASAAAAELAVCSRRLVDIAHELDEHRASAAGFRAALLERDQRADELRNAVAAAEERARRAEAELEVARGTIAGVLSSTSWRLTAPLRQIAELRRRSSHV